MIVVDYRSGIDCFVEVVCDLKCDLIVNVQVDELLVVFSIIDFVVQVLSSNLEVFVLIICCLVMSVMELLDLNVVKVVVDIDGYVFYFL